MSALSAIEAAEFDEVVQPAGARLRLVAAPGPATLRPGSGSLAGVSPRPGAARVPARPAIGAAIAPARPVPLRLTRRGRIVVLLLAGVLATVVITVASMASSGAQAANHGRPGGGYAGMHQIVVQPGQSLWSIAERAAPSADPRQVIDEIMTVNQMTIAEVQAGQLLWVPK